MGSLVTALASFLDARSLGQAWLIRMEDLDPPREQVGAAAHILEQLEAHGLHSDEPILFQSSRHQAYQEALQTLIDRGLAFACNCSRSQLEKDLAAGLTHRNADGEILYGGRCRSRPAPGPLEQESPQQAWRFRSADGSDDCVLKRADGFWAYHLAVVVDDAHQGITRIVRGDDLLSAMPRHRALQAALGLAQPEILHVPVVRNQAGEKLSKQTKAQAIGSDRPIDNLEQAWHHLQQTMERRWVASAQASFERLVQALKS